LRSAPDPEVIRWVALRAGPEISMPGGLAAGDVRHWGLTIEAAEEGLLVVFANANVENGLQRDLESRNAEVELTVQVAGAPIGRTLVTVESGSQAVISAIAPILVSQGSLIEPGLLRPSITLKAFNADLGLGDINATGLFLPTTMGHFMPKPRP